MCDKRNSTYGEYSLYSNGKFKNKYLRLDSCMADLISKLNNQGKETLACCCGHEKYEKTVVCRFHGKNIELFSGIEIPRQKRFYIRDKEGIYHIPEVKNI
jgi:hypothetical protein